MAILTWPSHASPVCLTLCSCAQVYNDKLNDMLSRPVRHDLRMREVGGGKGVTAEGLHLEVVTSVEEVMDCLKRVASPSPSPSPSPNPSPNPNPNPNPNP